MTRRDPEAAAWAGMGFDASLIGLRAAIERVLIDLDSVSRAGGDVRRCQATLAAIIADLQRRADAIPAQAGDPVTQIAEPTPHGLPGAPSSSPPGWGFFP